MKFLTRIISERKPLLPFSRTTEIEKALRKVVPREALKQAKIRDKEGALIEFAAKNSNIDSNTLLELVGIELGLRTCSNIIIPTAGLVRKTGYNTGELRKVSAVPQESSNPLYRYSIVTARPELLALKKFEENGIEVLLSTAREVSRAWASFEKIKDSKEARKARILEALFCTAQRARSQGASRLEIAGSPKNSYRFVGRDGVYSGRISAGLFQELKLLAGSEGKARYRSDKNDFGEIELSIADNNAELIWEGKEENEKPAALKQPKEVVIVDDDPRFLHLLEKTLNGKGYTTVSKTNTLEAIAYLQNGRPSLAICDLHMPTFDGRAFLQNYAG